MDQNSTIELHLPALEQRGATIATPAGVLGIPGRRLAAKTVRVDPAQLQRLLAAAREAAARAYAPYSRFRVGAALLMADDSQQRVFSGVNVENSSYGVTCCAERNALFAAATAGCRRLRLLAVTTLDALERPLSERSPCGVCRQVIREFADADTLILIDSGAAARLCEVFDIDRLLPYGFCFGAGSSTGPTEPGGPI